MVDPGRGVPGHLHAAAGHHDRERGPAGYPAGAAFEFLRPAVDCRRLCADPGGVPADGGQPGRHVRPPPAVPGRPGDFHLRVGPVRFCRQHGDAAVVPRLAGSRRGGHVRGIAGAAGGLLPRQGPRRRVRRLGRGDRPGGGHRAAARRGADLRPVLALDLLRERADRPRGRHHRAGQGGRVARGPGQPARLARLLAVHGGAVEPGLRPHRVEPAVLHRRPGPRLPRPGGRAAGRLRPGGTAPCGADVRHAVVQAADLQRRRGRGVRAQRLDLRDAALPRAVPAGHSRLLAAGYRRAADGDLRRHPGHLHRGRR